VVPDVHTVNYVLAPLIAAAALGILVLICRWVFSTDHREDRTARRLDSVLATRDYGLLVPLTTARTREDAEMFRDLLRGAGINAGVSADLEVLVFSKDLARARQLVSAP
jgi:hypothetical protein